MTDQDIGAKAFFDNLASGWAARYDSDPAMAARLDRFTRALCDRVPNGAAVLDFGCGAGVIACWLAERGYAISGCDASAEMIAQARSRSDAGIVRWDISSNRALPYADGSFAAVISSSVLEYVVDLDAALSELRRVLLPDGWLLATVPDSRHPHRRKEALLRMLMRLPVIGSGLADGRWREGAAYLRLSCNRMNPQGWMRLLVANGYQVEPAAPCEGPLLLLAARRAGDDR